MTNANRNSIATLGSIGTFTYRTAAVIATLALLVVIRLSHLPPLGQE